MKILIVDDDENSRVYLERALLKQGFAVESAPNGAEALNRAEVAPPELIISDILMPDLDGFELCRRVKCDDRLRGIPFIFYSATYVTPEDRRLAMKLGASRFLIKPMELEVFSNLIREVLGEYRQARLEIPRAPLAEGGELDRMQIQALTHKLEHKVREIAREREARRKLEQDYRELKENMKEVIRQAVEEERRKDDGMIIQGRQAVMEEMINNIAHQWRQPINTLGLLAQDLQMTFKLGEFSREYIEANVKRTMEVIQAMSKTIDDFRTFFKPNREQVEFRVLRVITKIRSFLEGGFDSKQIRLELECADDPVVKGYPGEFSQVILNILINARDAFAGQKIAEPLVRVRVSCEGGKTVILITDNAGGIPPDIIEKIFDPYFTTKGPDRGTGIGLFMSKSIIEKNMGGSLTARNLDHGAEFRIELQSSLSRTIKISPLAIASGVNGCDPTGGTAAARADGRSRSGTKKREG
jgi:C4-dicarboxylate-specific signal transduction histidine kinase